MSNEALEPGVQVLYWPGAREGVGLLGRTLSGRQLLAGHTSGYYIRKASGGTDFVAETHIQALSDDATPPLVAASPVPPVVPDSGETQHKFPSLEPPVCWFCLKRLDEPSSVGCNAYGHPASEASGSGVVPDKPALAPELCNTALLKIPHGEHSTRAGVPCPGYAIGDPVPAVTDDEAATRAARETIYDALHERAGCPNDESCGAFWVDADAVLAALREDGFLIVHHTKET